MPIGRRAEKRRGTFRRVTAAAADLFAGRGYAATTVEEIAAAAGISAGTVYNHFGTKGGILLAVTMVRSTDDLDAAAAMLDVELMEPLDAAMAVVMTYITPLIDLDRTLAAEVFGASFQPSQRTMAAEFESRDQLAIGHLVEVFAAFRARGAIRGDVDPQQAAMLVFSVAAVAVMVYLASDSFERDAIGPFIRAHVELALRGIAG